VKHTIYLPDDLAAEVKAELGGDTNISAICQQALRDELARPKPRPSSKTQASQAAAHKLADAAASLFADADADMKRKVANWLRYVPTEREASGLRWWPQGLPRPYGPDWRRSDQS